MKVRCGLRIIIIILTENTKELHFTSHSQLWTDEFTDRGEKMEARLVNDQP
jgi:hypothetical protein